MTDRGASDDISRRLSEVDFAELRRAYDHVSNPSRRGPTPDFAGSGSGRGEGRRRPSESGYGATKEQSEVSRMGQSHTRYIDGDKPIGGSRTLNNRTGQGFSGIIEVIAGVVATALVITYIFRLMY